MFAQANSEHYRLRCSTPPETSTARQPRSWVRHDQAYARGLARAHAVGLSGQCRRYRGQRGAAILRRRRWRLPRHAEQIDFAIKVETHTTIHGDRRIRAATGAGGRSATRARHRSRRRQTRPASPAFRSHLRIPGLPRPWETARPLPPRMASASRSCATARSAPPHTTTNSPSGPGATSAVSSTKPACRRASRLRQADHDRRRPGQYPPRPRAEEPVPGRRGDRARRPGDAHRPGGGAASSVASGAPVRRRWISPRCSATTRDAAALPGVIDACWALGEANPIVSIHDVGAGIVQCHSGDPARRGRRRPSSIWAGFPAMTRSSPHAALVQRIAGTLCAGELGRASGRVCRAVRARARCPFAAVGVAMARTAAGRLRCRASAATRAVARVAAATAAAGIDLPMDVLFGKAPKMHRDATQTGARRSSGGLRRVALTGRARVALPPPWRPSPSSSPSATAARRRPGGATRWSALAGACRRLRCDAGRLRWLCPARRWRWASRHAGQCRRGATLAVGEAITNLCRRAPSPTSTRSACRQTGWRGQPSGRCRLFDAPCTRVGMELCPALASPSRWAGDSLSMQTVGTTAIARRRPSRRCRSSSRPSPGVTDACRR